MKLLLMNMSWYTVAYFHERTESFLAMVSGMAVFQGLAAWALYGEHVWSDERGGSRGVAVETESLNEKGRPAGKSV